jgi:hypothetical protein
MDAYQEIQPVHDLSLNQPENPNSRVGLRVAPPPATCRGTWKSGNRQMKLSKG